MSTYGPYAGLFYFGMFCSCMYVCVCVCVCVWCMCVSSIMGFLFFLCGFYAILLLLILLGYTYEVGGLLSGSHTSFPYLNR